MSKLQWALYWASRGFPVFPLEANGKEPIHDGWPNVASTDADEVRAMWRDPVLGTERDYNVGICCTDRVVIDVDVKDGKDGYNEYAQLSGNQWDTLTVRTPTGGYHLFFEGPDSGNASISKAVDVRSHNGYVVAAGSTIDGRAYEIHRDMEPAWVPYAVERLLAPYIARDDRTILTTHVDDPAAIQAAINFLQTTPPAVEGQRGDETTYIVAARLVNELAISPDMALQLLWEHYNPRCMPPWSLDELTQKVQNAASYGTANQGRIEASVLYGGLPLIPAPSLLAQAGVDWGNALDAEATPKRPWLVDRLLMIGMVTAILAQGSAGKSTLALVIAAHVAMGKSIGPFTVHAAVKAIVYNGEDDKAEQSRRLQAVCLAYGFDYNEVRKRVMLLSDEDLDARLVILQGRDPVVNQPVYNALLERLRDPDVGLFVGDPLVDLHGVDEGESGHMNIVMRTIKRLCTEAICAALVMHHTTKAGSEKQENRIGNMDISRGSSAIVFKARAAFTLMTASAQDCEDYGLQEHERPAWARLDDAKMNFTLASDKATWFKREGIKIINGDVVGILRQQELTKSTTHLKLRIAGVLIDNMIANNMATMQLMQAVEFVRQAEPLYANKTVSDVRAKLEGMFGVETEVRGHRLRIERPKDKTGAVLLVLS